MCIRAGCRRTKGDTATKKELPLYRTDGKARRRQGIIIAVIAVEETYDHCPRAYHFAKLWDTEQIAANRAARPAPLRLGWGGNWHICQNE